MTITESKRKIGQLESEIEKLTAWLNANRATALVGGREGENSPQTLESALEIASNVSAKKEQIASVEGTLTSLRSQRDRETAVLEEKQRQTRSERGFSELKKQAQAANAALEVAAKAIAAVEDAAAAIASEYKQTYGRLPYQNLRDRDSRLPHFEIHANLVRAVD